MDPGRGVFAGATGSRFHGVDLMEGDWIPDLIIVMGVVFLLVLRDRNFIEWI